LEYQENIIFCLNYTEEKKAEIETRLNHCFRLLLEVTQPFPFYSLILGVGLASDNFNDLVNSYKESYLCVKSRVMLGKNRIISNSLLNLIPEDFSFTECKNTWIHIAKCVELHHKEALLDSLEKLYMENMPFFDMYPYVVYDWYKSMILKIMHIFFEYAFIPSSQTINFDSIYHNIDLCSSLEKLKIYCKEEIFKMFDDYNNAAKDTDIITIQIAKQYITENYEKKLELEEVAQQVYLSLRILGLSLNVKLVKIILNI
jgi:two-component system response regulator YesN